MLDENIILPSKPRIVSESEYKGQYEIDGLYPGYGHTLGNSLRRIMLSSLQGAAITRVKIDGVSHEFSTIEGVKEDVINILLNLKQVRFELMTNEPQIASLKIKGEKEVTAADFNVPGQVRVVNVDQHIASLTDKKAELSIEVVIEKGLGYVSKERMQHEKMDIGEIALDAIFTPIRRVNYEVENMRVGDRTDFNRLRFNIETDGTISPHDVLERSIEIMIEQLKAIIGFKDDEIEIDEINQMSEDDDISKISETEFLKTRIEDLGLSQRALNVLSNANIRTVGGLVRKKKEDIIAIEGLGDKVFEEIEQILNANGIELKE